MKSLILLIALCFAEASLASRDYVFECKTLGGKDLRIVMPEARQIEAFVNGKQVRAYSLFMPRSLQKYGNHRYTIEGNEFIWGIKFSSLNEEWAIYQVATYGYERLKCDVTVPTPRRPY